MKRLGILGGMSWESTALYYRWLNEGVKEQLKGLHSADLIVRSVDFAQIETWQAAGEWALAGDYLALCAQELAVAGAQGLVIATNTMHKVAEQIEHQSNIELLHIADCTGRRLQQQGVSKVGLLGTGFTMEQAFYKDRLTERFDMEVIVPNEQERGDVHNIIYNELCLGKIRESSRDRYLTVTENLASQGAEVVILGCTEICMLLTPDVTDVPLLDTTQVHAEEAVNWMLG